MQAREPRRLQRYNAFAALAQSPVKTRRAAQKREAATRKVGTQSEKICHRGTNASNVPIESGVRYVGTVYLAARRRWAGLPCEGPTRCRVRPASIIGRTHDL